MFDLDAMATFVAVVRAGHFASASKALRLPKSTVSQRVARLEASLGVRLIERTTRVLRPTNAGAAYYERCARIISEVEEANAAMTDLRASPRGLLRVATPPLFGEAFLAGFAASFCRRHPDVQIDVVASDRRVNLVEEGFDVAIVVAAADPDSTLISRMLGGGERWCCAAPSYLEPRIHPTAPRDLAKHDCVITRDHSAGGGAAWTFERGDAVEHVTVQGRLTLSSLTLSHAAALAGAGIATLPSFICADDVRNGRLVRVLSDWSVDRNDIKVIYPSSRHLSPRVRRFVDALVAEYSARVAASHGPIVPRRRRAKPEKKLVRRARAK